MLGHPSHISLNVHESDFLRNRIEKEQLTKQQWAQMYMEDAEVNKIINQRQQKSEELALLRHNLETDHRKMIQMWQKKYKVVQDRISEADQLRSRIVEHEQMLKLLHKSLEEKENEISTLADDLRRMDADGQMSRGMAKDASRRIYELRKEGAVAAVEKEKEVKRRERTPSSLSYYDSCSYSTCSSRLSNYFDDDVVQPQRPQSAQANERRSQSTPRQGRRPLTPRKPEVDYHVAHNRSGVPVTVGGGNGRIPNSASYVQRPPNQIGRAHNTMTRSIMGLKGGKNQ